MKKIILYARVTSDEQNIAPQVNALKLWARGADPKEIEIVEEKIEGAVLINDRLIGEVIKRNDIKQIVVQSLEILGRDAIDLMKTLKSLKKRDICLTILDRF